MVKTPQLNSPERGCGGPLHPRPTAPPHSVARCFPGSQDAGGSDGIPLDAINISFAFLWSSPPPSVSLNLFHLLSPSKCYPVTYRGEVQPSQAQAEQGREEGQAPRQMEKGKEGRRKAERRGERSSCRVPCGRLADGVSLSLSLSLPPSLNTEPCTALQKMGVWRMPPHLSLSL